MLAWTRLDSLGLAWTHLDSLGENGMVWYGMVLVLVLVLVWYCYGMVWYGTVRYGSVRYWYWYWYWYWDWYCTVRYGTVRYGTGSLPPSLSVLAPSLSHVMKEFILCSLGLARTRLDSLGKN